LFKFLEQYLERLEGPVALQVWGRFVQLVKDLTGGTREFKINNYLALRYASNSRNEYRYSSPQRCLTMLADKVTQTTAMEDRRFKKELQVGTA